MIIKQKRFFLILLKYRYPSIYESESSGGVSGCTTSDGENDGRQRRSTSRKRSRIETDKSNTSTSITVINNECTLTSEFVKSVGFKYPIDKQLFIYFPFQVYEFKECKFVTEYKSFHGMNCFKNSFRYLNNSCSDTVNLDCFNLKYIHEWNKFHFFSEFF